MTLNDKPIHILLVEDDEVDIMNVKRAFSRQNIQHPLHIASNGLEALDLLRGPNALNPLPRLVLLDINMPKMNGIEFLRELRADEKLRSLTVFVLTTSNQEKDKREAYELNIAGYVIKPVDFGSFLNTVSTLSNYWDLIEFSDSVSR